MLSLELEEENKFSLPSLRRQGKGEEKNSTSRLDLCARGTNELQATR